MSIDRRRSGIWQDANSNQSIASRRDYRMNYQKSPLHGAALRAARSGRLLNIYIYSTLYVVFNLYHQKYVFRDKAGRMNAQEKRMNWFWH